MVHGRGAMSKPVLYLTYEIKDSVYRIPKNLNDFNRVNQLLNYDNRFQNKKSKDENKTKF